MSAYEHIAVASEIEELEALLSEIPEDNLINRMGLESRLKKAKAAVQEISKIPVLSKARLTFRGKPVVGSHGVSAEFAAKASSFFTDAFTAVVAGLNENLRYMGPIPDKQKNQLLITGTALGSFGFEYELPQVEESHSNGQAEFFPAPEHPQEAMEKLERLFEVSAVGTDDDIGELVDEIHPRAVKKAAEFLGYLSDQEAWCGLEFRNSFFRFSGIDQVRQSVGRLESNNIKESDEEYVGEFQGVLPKSRTFEFKLSDEETIVRGKVGPEIEDADVLNREFLHRKNLRVTFHVIQVGQGRPRYTLQTLPSVD